MIIEKISRGAAEAFLLRCLPALRKSGKNSATPRLRVKLIFAVASVSGWVPACASFALLRMLGRDDKLYYSLRQKQKDAGKPGAFRFK
jgi:hypothetical protein